MKKKIINFIIDIPLIWATFFLSDIVVLKVFHSESLWLELGFYLLFYALFFGAKNSIVFLWKKHKSS